MLEPSRFASTHQAATETRETANDRFKLRFGVTFWSSLIAAVSVHFLLFAFFPTMRVAGVSPDPEPPELIVLPPELHLPPPPEPLARPALPIPSDVAPPEITIPPMLRLPDRLDPLPPPAIRHEDGGRAEAFTPFEVAPRLRNGEEIERLLQRRYPPILRDAGISGVVGVRIYIDEEGSVLESRLETPSEHEAFNHAALEVIHSMKFTPALNRDRRVRVWVSIPIRFQTR
jgi:protein TonB